MFSWSFLNKKENKISKLDTSPRKRKLHWRKKWKGYAFNWNTSDFDWNIWVHKKLLVSQQKSSWRCCTEYCGMHGTEHPSRFSWNRHLAVLADRLTLETLHFDPWWSLISHLLLSLSIYIHPDRISSKMNKDTWLLMYWLKYKLEFNFKYHIRILIPILD